MTAACPECGGEGSKTETLRYRQPPPGDAVFESGYQPAPGSALAEVEATRPCIQCGGRGGPPGYQRDES